MGRMMQRKEGGGKSWDAVMVIILIPLIAFSFQRMLVMRPSLCPVKGFVLGAVGLRFGNEG